MTSGLFLIAFLFVLVVLMPIQAVLIWLTAKIVDAPNVEFKDAFKLSAALTGILAVGFGGYLGIVKYDQPQTIQSTGWLIIMVGFCAVAIATFWSTINILGVGFFRALLVGFLTNVFWRVLGLVSHAIMTK